MAESFQDQYATNLKQSFGYPLRFPEPMPNLPTSYAESGLQIGDVGYVSNTGMFEVLFNICFPSHHDLHRDKNLTGLEAGLAKFNLNEAPLISDGIPAGRAICHGVHGPQGDVLRRTKNAPCSFKSCSTSGAILILPSGAVSQSLNEELRKEFCRLAEEHAPKWSEFCGRKSFYLITGFYKTRSWYLASFRDVRPTQQILLNRDDAGGYDCDSRCDFRRSPEDNLRENQTVFISGFKIEVRSWDDYSQARVERLSHPKNLWSDLMFQTSFLVNILVAFLCRVASTFKVWDYGTPKGSDQSVQIDGVPALSQPFHPSDVINRYKLEKDTDLKVAITHDDRWLSMIEKNEISIEGMMEEDRFRGFLEESYTEDPSFDSKYYVVNLSKMIGTLRKSTCSSGTFFIPNVPDDARVLIITGIRADHIVISLMRKRMLVGFYVVMQHNGTKRSTRCKPASLCEDMVEWDDEIILPLGSAVEIQFSVIASSEFEPLLGNGELLCTAKTSSDKLVGNGSSYLLSLPSVEGVDTNTNTLPPPSLLITLEERRVDGLSTLAPSESSFECHDPLPLGVAEQTDNGHDMLLQYHGGTGTKKLLESVECFKAALDLCPPNHDCRPAAMFNYATATFLHCQARGVISDLDVAIEYYHNALKSRLGRHPDRPRTLVYLAQSLLYQGRLQHNTPATDRVENLAKEVKQICSKSSYDYRAADLIVQTLKRHQILTSGELIKLDKFISELDRSSRIAPEWHFDRPYRLVNLSTALFERFRIFNDLGSLTQSISVMQDALQLVPGSHFDRPWMLASLGDRFYLRFVRHGNVVDLHDSISQTEDALNLIADGHMEKPHMLASLGDSLCARFIHNGVDTDLDNSIIKLKEALDLASNNHSEKPRMQTSLGKAFLVRFVRRGDVVDLDRCISTIEDALNLAPDDHEDKLRKLNSLVDAFHVRFIRHGDASDLERVMFMLEEGMVTLKDAPDPRAERPRMIAGLGIAHLLRFFGHRTSVLERAIHMTKISLHLTSTAWMEDYSRRSNESGDLDDAILYQQRAVELLPDDNPQKAGCLTNLATSLLTRFRCLRDPSDLEKAISSYQDAVRLVPDDRPDKPQFLNDLALSVKVRFERSNELSDLYQAISIHRDIIKLTPDEHPDRPNYQKSLCDMVSISLSLFSEGRSRKIRIRR